MKHLHFLIDVPKVGPVHYNTHRIYPERRQHEYDVEDYYDQYDNDDDDDLLGDHQR